MKNILDYARVISGSSTGRQPSFSLVAVCTCCVFSVVATVTFLWLYREAGAADYYTKNTGRFLLVTLRPIFILFQLAALLVFMALVSSVRRMPWLEMLMLLVILVGALVPLLSMIFD
jgi:hypothetical protein